MNDKAVFFILGSVRSGTTLLRDILKSHPNLACPEETHIFRWADPFNSNDYNHVNKVADTLIMHREMDGIEEANFYRILQGSADRKEFMLNYLNLFQKSQGNTTTRCFDKTPQNVYGLPLIKAYFPDAKIIHIVRNPLNVISSLKQGRGLLPQTLTGAINFWKESILIINTLKPLLENNLYEFKYEDLTEKPALEISKLLDFLEEDQADMSHSIEQVTPAKNNYLQVLNKKEIANIYDELSDLMNIYGYSK